MKKILIGSRALYHNFPFVNWRSGESDLDYLVATQDLSSFEKEKEEYRKMGWDCTPVSHSIFDKIWSKCRPGSEDEERIIDSISLLTLKLSHLGWDLDWFKHHSDILKILEALSHERGTKVSLIETVERDLFRELYAWWDTARSDKRRLSLNMSKEEFFDDAVTKVYDHDYLHELVAFPDPPLYSLCQKDGAEVAINLSKFSKLESSQRVKMFREEATVISIERWLVNPEVSPKPTWQWAYGQALKKLCTTLTKGWATRFCLLHLDELSELDEKLLSHAKEVLNLKYPQVDKDLEREWMNILQNSKSLSQKSPTKMWEKEEIRVIQFEEKYLQFKTWETCDGFIKNIFQMKEVTPKKVTVTQYA